MSKGKIDCLEQSQQDGVANWYHLYEENPKSSIEPALYKAKHIYLELGYTQWEPYAVKTFFKTGESLSWYFGKN